MLYTITKPNPVLQWAQPLHRRQQTGRIIIHHYHHAAATPHDVHRWHLANGWAGFGYNFAVDMDGTIWQGRGMEYIGTHTAGHNADSIGIAVQGRYDDHTQHMPDAQFDALVWLVHYVQRKYGGGLKLLRHRDLAATACPGRYFPWDDVVEASDAIARGADWGRGAGQQTELPDVPRFPVKPENIQNMVDLGVITVADYWRNVNIEHLDLLLERAAKSGRLQTSAVNDVQTPHGALVILNYAGIVAVPEYWQRLVDAQCVTLWLGQLLVNMANRVAVPQEVLDAAQAGLREQTLLLRARESLTPDDVRLLTILVHHEARGEDARGQILVANVVFNRMVNTRDGSVLSLRDVVFHPGAFAPAGRAGFMDAQPSAMVRDSVQLALAGADYSRGALFFHAPTSLTPDVWHERAARDGRILFLFDHGGHRFYR